MTSLFSDSFNKKHLGTNVLQTKGLIFISKNATLDPTLATVSFKNVLLI